MDTLTAMEKVRTDKADKPKVSSLMLIGMLVMLMDGLAAGDNNTN